MLMSWWSRRFLNFDFMATKAENPDSHKYVVGNGSETFSASINKIGLSLGCARNWEKIPREISF